MKARLVCFGLFSLFCFESERLLIRTLMKPRASFKATFAVALIWSTTVAMAAKHVGVYIWTTLLIAKAVAAALWSWRHVIGTRL